MELPWPTCPTHNTEPVRQEDFTSLLVLEEVPGEKITRHNNVCFLDNSSNNMFYSKYLWSNHKCIHWKWPR